MLLPMLLLSILPWVVSPLHARTTPIMITNRLPPFIVGFAAVDAAALLLIILHVRGILVGRWDILLGLSTLNLWFSTLHRILAWHTLDYR